MLLVFNFHGTVLMKGIGTFKSRVKRNIGLCCFLSLYCTSAFSFQSKEDIAVSDKWLALLHYEQNASSTPVSAINSDEFFFSDTGRTDSLSELNATLTNFTERPSTQCQFPARAEFLQRHVHLPMVNCDEVNTFLDNVNANSVSLIYASGYLGNPASMYGHIFLKFNQESKTALLDNTYSYGARHPDNENPLKYIVKGIFGGYEGYFANQKYHHQTLVYSESELRDLWEYRLALSTDDVTFLLKHLFELEGASKTYYFFSQNCAYQLARLLGIVTDKQLIAPGKPWVMPYDIITMLYRDNNASIVDGVIYHGSRQEKLYEHFSQLEASLQGVVENTINQTSDIAFPEIETLRSEDAKRVIETLYDYYALVEQKNDGLSDSQLAKRKSLMKQRFTLPIGKAEFKETEKQAPHLAQDSTLLQVSAIDNNVLGSAVEFRFRANYYDLLSVNTARIPFSELTTFDMRVHYYTELDELTLRELTLLRLINLNATSTGLPGDEGYAWKLATGYRPQSLTDLGDGTFYIDGFFGKAISLSSDFALYGAASGSLTSKNDFGGNFSIGPEIGGVINVTPQLAMSLSFGHQRYLNDKDIVRNVMTFEQRFLNHKNMDLRTSFRYDGTHELSASFSYYF